MTREFILSDNRCKLVFGNKIIVGKALARAILFKFLVENNCFKEFVDSYKFHHESEKQMLPCDVITNCITRCINKTNNLDDIFRLGSISFSWSVCNHIKPFNFWSIINSKWKILTRDIYITEIPTSYFD